MSADTDESVVVKKDINLAQGESVIHLAGAGELLVSLCLPDIPVEKIVKCEDEARVASPE